MRSKFFLFVFLCIKSFTAFTQTNLAAKKLEKMIVDVARKVTPAVVKIAAFDTLSKTTAISRFSGVIVQANGLILTASHATQPNQIYQVVFSNGQKVLAKGLGRIQLSKNHSPADVAMLKIMDRGVWPFAEMSYSAHMRIGQPCIGISYPGTFEQKSPNIRLGRLENIDINKGNFQSSCKMEPGDSGGPLFDILGRVIGIHSWILAGEDENFEVPIDFYHKYWNALQLPVNYDQLPRSNSFECSSQTVLNSIPPLDQLSRLSSDAKQTLVQVKSEENGTHLSGLGTLLSIIIGDTIHKAVVAKSSSTGDSIRVVVGDKETRGYVIARDGRTDLVLLKIEKNNSHFLEIRNGIKDKCFPGEMLFSPLSETQVRTGIASTGKIDMLAKYSIGYLGAKTSLIDGQVTITSIAKGSPADMVLRNQDKILSINGEVIESISQFNDELSRYFAKDNLDITAIRNGNKIKLTIKLGARPTNLATAESFLGGRSNRSDGFKQVIAQDAAIQADECGGPVFNSDGDFVGINIARHSRTSTIIVPASVIATSMKAYFGRTRMKKNFP